MFTIRSSAIAEIARVGSHRAVKVIDLDKPIPVLNPYCDYPFVNNTNYILFRTIIQLSRSMCQSSFLTGIGSYLTHSFKVVCEYRHPIKLGCLDYISVADSIQGGPAKVRPTYIFDDNIWMHR